MNAVAEREPAQFTLQCDGVAFALAFLSRLTEKGLSLEQWRTELPEVFRSARSVTVPVADRSRVLRALAEETPDAELGGGLRLPRENGWAWISASETGGEMQVMTEAASIEAADELCGFYEKELRRLLEQRD